MIKLQVERFFLIGRALVVLKSDSAQEDQELDIFHLIRLGLVTNSIYDSHHGLSVQCTHHHLRDPKINFPNEGLTLRHHHVAFLGVSERHIDLLDLLLVLLQNLVNFD